MIELLCGLLIGTVMGLTGAGGALIAIPLFMQFMNQSLKEASLHSLIAVVLASIFNFLAQKSHAKYRTGLIIVVSSTLGSFIAVPFKEILSTFWIALILSAISLYALYNIWFSVNIKTDKVEKIFERNLISIVVGLIMGGITTLTGIGGGVLMLPIFLRIYRFTRIQAVATSLFAVGFSSLSSLIIQVYKGSIFEVNASLIYLIFGILLAAFVLRRYLMVFKIEVLTRIQQVVFTMVVVLVLTKIFL